MALLSIVIPAYNVARFIRATVESLCAQEYADWVAVVIDDGSPDDILGAISALLDSDSRIRYVRKANGGVSSARNYGYRQVAESCRYIMFLDGDDVLKPQALRVLVAELENHPEAGMVHCEPEFIDEKGCTIPDREWLSRMAWRGGKTTRLGPEDRETPFESVYSSAGIIPSVSFLRCTVFEQTPGYDEDFGQHCEDTDLNLQMAIRAPVRYLPEKLVCYRVRSGQSSANLARHEAQGKKLYSKWRNISGLTPDQMTTVKRAEAFRSGPLAAYLGYRAAVRHWKAGKFALAFRFWQGALRRSFKARMSSILK